MLQSEALFQRTDYVLGCLGFRLYPKSKLAKWTNYFLRIAGLLLYYVTIVGYLMSNRQHEDLLLSIWFVIKYVILIISHNIFWWKMNAYREVHEEIVEIAERFKGYSNAKAAKLLPYMWIAGTLASMLVAVFKSHSWRFYQHTGEGSESIPTIDLKLFLSALFFDTVFMLYTYGWFFATCVWYAFLYSALQELSRKMSANYTRRLLDEEDAEQVGLLQELKWNRQTVQSAQRKINKHLGVYPFIWLLVAALEISWLVITTDSLVLSDYWLNFAALTAHDVLLCAFVFGTLFYAFRVYRAELSATSVLLGFLKTSAIDSRDLVSEKVKLVAEIGVSPVIAPKMLNYVPINVHSVLVYFIIVLVFSVVIRLFDQAAMQTLYVKV